MKTSERISHDHSPVVLAVSLVAGFGLTLMLVILGIGAVQGAAANTGTITVGFLLGLAIFIIGVVGWFLKVQPQRHFDDINQPLPDEHGHGHDSHDDHAHDEAQPATAGHH